MLTLRTKLKMLNQCLEFRTLVQIVWQDLQNTKWKQMYQSVAITEHMTVNALNEVQSWALGEITEVLLSPAQLCFPEAESLDYEK